MNTIMSIGSGVSTGYTMIALKLGDEIAARDTANPYNRAMGQFIQISMAESLALNALSHVGVNYSNTLASWTIQLVPFAIAYGVKNFQNPLLKKTFTAIHENLGNLAQLTAIVSTVGLLVLGQPVMAISSLSFVAVYILDKNNLIPKHIINKIYIGSLIIQTSYGLVFGSLLFKIIVISNLITEVSNRFFNKPVVDPVEELGELKIFDQSGEVPQVGINKNHIRPIPLKNVGDLHMLEQFCDEINWVKYSGTIYMAEKDNDKTEQEYIKGLLSQIIKGIEQGQVQGNKKLISLYFKNIALLMKDLPIEEKERIFFRLILEDGINVSYKKVKLAETIYNELKLKSAATPLNEKLRIFLQLQRDELVEHLNHEYETFDFLSINTTMINAIPGAIDVSDKEKISPLFLQVLGEEFGLSYQAESSNLYQMSNLEKMFYRLIASEQKEAFWEAYNKSVISKIYSGVRNEVITKDDIKNWWTNWLSKQNDMPESEKETFFEKNDIYSFKYYNAMLLGCGIYLKA